MPQLTSRAFVGAYRKGRLAAMEGKSRFTCPYPDYRAGRRGNITTYSRTFQRVWREGWDDAQAGRNERYAVKQTRKRPAPGLNVGLDVDAGIIAKHVAACDRRYDVLHVDSLTWLGEFLFPARPRHRQTLVYCDPPYLGSARGCERREIYRHEMKGEEDHRLLLRILTTTTAMVMISGYASTLYDVALATWRRVTFMAQTRGGMKEEVVWMNYPEPTALHDYRYLGENYHDRCRIGRKIKRTIAKLAAMPPLERAAVLSAIGHNAKLSDRP